MAVHVYTAERTFRYPDATGWLIDDHGHLHVIGKQGAGNDGTIHRDHWTGVGRGK